MSGVALVFSLAALVGGCCRVLEDRGVSRLLAILVVSLTVAGCSLGDDEPESAVAASQFVTELIRLGSGDEQGRVGLSAVGDSTRVVVELSDPPKDPREVEIHSGNCDVLGTAVYGLQPLENGVSTTVVDIGLEPLRRMGYTVMVSDPSGTPGGLCGDLAQAQPPSAAPTFD